MMSARMELYYERKAHGLCVQCGAEAVQGKTKCETCADFDKMYMKEKYHRMTPEQKAHKLARDKAWLMAHPDRVAEYKRRKPEYNRRYTEK